ncbi:MAG: porin family protein [Elusimicrobiota bacterium]|jgi:opacity protein-like surface antigen|nr:porin family protein [Elusimicrobiota bacterium]
MNKIIILSMLILISTIFAPKPISAAGGVYIGGGYNMRTIFFNSAQLGEDLKAQEKIEAQSFNFFAGYKFNAHFRSDIQYISVNETLLKEVSVSQRYNYKASAIFANLLYDFFDISYTKISPFIGAGIGIASPSIVRIVGEEESSYNSSGFSYQFQGGLNILFFDLIILTLKYSYISFPPIPFNNISNNFEGQAHSFGIGISLLV